MFAAGYTRGGFGRLDSASSTRRTRSRTMRTTADLMTAAEQPASILSSPRPTTRRDDRLSLMRLVNLASEARGADQPWNRELC
jgi:hypothetical protein